MDPILIVSSTLTVGLTEIIKKTKIIPEQFIPLTALIIGIALGLFQSYGIIGGIMIGLSANGLYSGVKKTME